MNNKSNPIRTAAKRTATALLALAALCACTDDLDTGSKPYVHTPGQLGIAQITLGDNPNLNARAAASTAPTTTAATPTAPTTRTATEDGATAAATAGKLIVRPNTAITTLQGGDQLMAAYNFSSSTDVNTGAALATYTALATRAADGGAWTLQPAPGTGQPDAAPVLRPNSAATTGESWAGARLTLSLVGQPDDAMAPDDAYDPADTVAQWHAPAGMYATATTRNIGGSGSSSSDVQVLHFFDALRANTSADANTDPETDANGAPLRGRVAIDRGTSSPTLGQISASMAHAGALMSLPRTAISGGSIIVGNSKLDITPQSVVGLYAVVSTNKLGNDATQPAGDVYVAFSSVGIGGQDHLQAIVPGNAEVKRFVAMISQPNPSAGGDPILTPLTIALTQTKTLKADYRYPMTLALKGSTATIALALPDKPGWGTADDETELADGMPYIEYVGGEGTTDNPLRYTTSHALGLRLLQQWINGDLGAAADYAPKTQILNSTISNRRFTHITLTRDINLNDLEPDPAKSNWAPIGGSGSYRGTFDGGGHTLKNLRIVNASRDNQGLIGTLTSPSTVKNLTLEDVNISSTKEYVGAVVGQNILGRIENCHVTASAPDLSTVSGVGYTGGIVGKNYGGTLTQCTNAAAVEGSDNTGGITGTSNGGTLTQCTNAAAVEGKNFIGGITGYNADGSIIMACSNSGTIKSQQSTAGGIAGENSAISEPALIIVACSNTGNITANYGTAGGIAGSQNGANAYLYGCWSTGSVTNGYGIIGAYSSSTIAGCFTTQTTITDSDRNVDATNGIVPTTGSGWNGTATNGATTGINILACMNGAIGKYNALPHVTADATLECNHIYIANPKDATQPPVLKYLPAGYEKDGSGQWLIYNAKGLTAFRDQVNQGGTDNRALKAQLMTSITMPATPWTECISKDGNTYKGTFDGAGHTIYGLKVDMNGGVCYAGLFFAIAGGTVKNLTLSDVSISGSSNLGVCAGGIVGWTSVAGRIENCHVTGTSSSVTATGSGSLTAGGIVGLSNGGSVVMGCSNTGCNVTIQSAAQIVRVGGIVGCNGGSSVTACSNTGTVGATGGTNENYAGGIVGKSYITSNSITACWSTGTATATSSSSKNNAGGIVGNTSDGATVTTCYTTQPIGITGAGELVSDPITTTQWTALNTAIDGWNTTNPAKKCPYRFDTANGAITKPVTP